MTVSRLLPKNMQKKGRQGYACGVVVDDLGDPLVGAIVTIKDSEKTVVTNIDGEFEIMVREPKTLSVNCIGYKSATVKAYPGSYLNIVLYPSTVLKEVVVGAGKRREGGSLSEPDANLALQGRIAGLDIVYNSSSFGENSIRVRGTSPMDDVADIPNNRGIQQPVVVRENFSETAFFMPTLRTGADGTATMAFTLPESVTTWRLQTLAYDKEANYAQHDTTVVAQKEVMVQPNLPRFVRSGDQSVIAASITSLSEQNHSGTALLQMLDPSTETVVWSSSKPFTVEGGSSA